MKFCALLILITLATLSSAAISNYRGSHNKNHFGSNAYTPATRTQTKSYTHSGNDKDVKILRNDQEMRNDGSYNYAYETSNGISGQEHGMAGVAVQGASSYISPEGVEIKLSYTADETGYHPVGDHIPKIPDYILRSLEYIRTHPYKVKTTGSSGSAAASKYTPAAASKYTPHPISTNIAPPTYRPAISRRLTAPPTPSKYKAVAYSRQSVANGNTKNQYRGNSGRYKY